MIPRGAVLSRCGARDERSGGWQARGGHCPPKAGAQLRMASPVSGGDRIDAGQEQEVEFRDDVGCRVRRQVDVSRSHRMSMSGLCSSSIAACPTSPTIRIAVS